MGVSEKHPLWAERVQEWAIARDTFRGEQSVKEKATDYLPMPSGFTIQADNGRGMYSAYITRAQFPEIFAPTIRGIMGIIHRSEAQFTMPAAMRDNIWEKATKDGLSLEALHRRITLEVLLTGRYGLMVDAPPAGGFPYFVGYPAEAIINWDPDRSLFVLNESKYVRNGFSWDYREQYRVLTLEGGTYQVRVLTSDNADLTDAAPVTPVAPGRRALNAIPFVTIGALDVSTEPDDPPLLGVARAALALYRLDADYRHQLFMSGQETLVIINGEPPAAIGAGAVLTLTGDGEARPDAKYIGPQGTGIAAHRTAIQDERENAVAAGSRLFDTSESVQESGEARKLRFAGATASLTSIAQASAFGLEMGLKHMATMIGEDPAGVVVKPDLKHLSGAISAADAKMLMEVWQGGGISYQTYYEKLQHGELTSPERSYEEELALIADERARLGLGDPGEDGLTSGREREAPTNG